MTVSSGTYVRSIVHDIGLALGCGAHVVTLTRTRQGQFTLHGDEEELASSKKEAMARWYAANPTDDASVARETKPVVEADGEMDEEAAFNGTATTSAPVLASASGSSTRPDQAQAEVDEEAMLNGPVTAGPSTGFSALPPKPSPFTQTKARLPGQTVDYTSSTVSIPWSVFENALADRKAMLDAEKAEQAEAATTNEVGQGEHKQKVTPEQMQKYFSKEQVMQRRRARPLQEWEEYVLARFEEVPVPIGGAHGTARYR
jgi:tRNA pseudouridine55 synthase